jgi:hypothetical protein
MAFDAARSFERSQPAFLKEVGASGLGSEKIALHKRFISEPGGPDADRV